MTTFSETQSATLPTLQQGPCFSLYMPTQRRHTATAQDVLSFRTLVEKFDGIKERYEDDETVQSVFAKFDALANDQAFWEQTREGLAVFAAPSVFHVYRLNQPVRAQAIAADHFHTDPLQEYLQLADSYHVLVLSANEARLYEGNRDQLKEQLLTGDRTANTVSDTFDGELGNLHATSAAPYKETGTGTAVSEHHGLGKTALNNNIEQFFRAIDRAVLEIYTKPSGLPLIVAALPAHDRMFRRVSQNQLLVEEGIPLNAGVLTEDELRKLAWDLFESYYEARIDHIVRTYRQATAHLRGADQIDQIVKDTYDGKVGTLLLEEGQLLPGKIIDRDRIEYYDGDQLPYNRDVLTDLGELVKRYGGEVVIVPSEKMPSSTGAAAINRF